MSTGPLPSQRCLLSALCKKQVGDKVRFLGCPNPDDKSSFVVESAELFRIIPARVAVEHRCPRENDHVEAFVDVKLLLETLKSEQTDVGQWVHVIGYLSSIHRNSSRSKTGPRVVVQALILWVARDLDLGAYEKSMLADANQNTGSLALNDPDAN
ncbi:CST complex subunit Ten1 [Xylaria sp. FL1777]|nr:CST complex subunit Ten1 [Xylaria sp. FL1777]